MEYITLFYKLIVYLVIFNLTGITAGPCQRRTTDIIFMLDSSFSMHKNQFVQQLKFVTNVVDHFEIGKDHTEVGILTFNHDIRVEFNLDAFLDKVKLKEAILTIPYWGGGTDIGEALRYGRLEMFSKQNGGRDNAKKLIVVITDGQSDNQTKTESEARLARLSGIHIISVGVGNAPNDKELGRIASKPKEQFVFKVDDFDSLDTIVDSLSEQTCNGNDIQNDQLHVPPTGCHDKPVDIFFVIDNSNSIWINNFKKVLRFITQIVSSFELSPTKTRVGVISYSDDAYLMLQLDNQMGHKEITETILNLKQLTGGTATGKAIRYLTHHGFSRQERPEAAKVALIFTDGKSKHPQETKNAAAEARNQGIFLISIGIEEQSDLQELLEIASAPKEKFTFHVKDYNTLETIKERLIISTCQVQADSSKHGDNHLCKFPVPTDITFIYDSSSVGLYRSKIIRKSITSVVKEIDFSDKNVKVGVLSKSCSKQKNIHFADYNNKAGFVAALKEVESDGLSHLIRKFRIKYKKERHFKNGHKSIVVLFIDDNLTFPETAWKEVKRTAFKHDVYAVTVDDIITKQQSEKLCSIPSSQFLFHSDNYNELPHTLLNMFKDICS